MNTISLFVYLAGVTSNLQAALTIILVVGGISLFGYILVASMETGSFVKPSTGIVVTFFVLVLVATLLPSENVVYMIAASELGEVVVNTPEAQEVYQDLRAIISNMAERVSE